MNTARAIFVVTMFLLCAAVPAGAQDANRRGATAAALQMDHTMPMTVMSRHTEGWLAFLKIELKITEAQAGAWGDFVQSMRANATRMNDSHASMMHQDAASAHLPERLMAQVQTMASELTALRRMMEAVEPLYAVLSDAQKKVADELLGQNGMM